MEGNWVEGTDNVTNAAVQFFQKLYTAQEILEDSQILIVVQRVITDAHNMLLTSLPSLEEVKDCIFFSICPNSSSGPDNLSGKFYQSA